MIEYELFYSVGESKEAELEAIGKKVEAIVTGLGGSFLPPQTTEKRKFAYEIQGEKRGTFIARRFTLPGRDEQAEAGDEMVNVLDQMNKNLLLEHDVLRFILVRADDLPELKAIERIQKPRTDRKKYEKRSTRTTATEAPITPVDEEKSKVSAEEIDKQLKSKLNI